MRGGGRGRGRGGGRGARDECSIPRTGPVMEELPAFPPNPRLAKAAPHLDYKQQCLVALNRIVVNHLKYLSPFQVEQKVEERTVQSFSESEKLSARADPQTQRDMILKLSNRDYFPAELLADRLIPAGRRRARPVATRTAGLRDDTAERKAGEEGEGGDEEAEEEEPEDFGGDDYAHDHYADEDAGDDVDDGGGDDDGGMF